ncbi:hypothetical protein E4P01_13265 [Pseudomonas sp. NCIMB 10586]|nr:hypothetical protein [Pseudomonas sp. NCIMB 10586]
MSISRGPQIAKEFATSGPPSTELGEPGLDVSAISHVPDEQEVLYNKGTKMRVLFSATDSMWVTKRVLKDATLPKDSRKVKRSLDAPTLS